MPDTPGNIRETFNKISYGENGEFTLGLDPAQLADIVDNKLRIVTLSLPPGVFENLAPANQRALAHLVKAADILNDVFLQQDHPDNLRARDALEKAAASGDQTAEQALTLFTLHNGLQGIDMYAPKSVPLCLFSDKHQEPGKGFYPQDMTKDELAEYVLAHPEEASALFSNNTMVRRAGEHLEAVPYSVAFRPQMQGAARELLAAAKETDHKGLAEYLRWQAQQLVNDSDPEMAYRADSSWVNKLEDSPLEFTIGRECYDDRLSSDTAADPRVKAMLEENGIKAKSKDTIGVRVGIVNMESYAEIADYRKHLADFAEQMPLKDQYKQGAGESPMTFADVDLVAVSGRYAAVRSGMTLAQNLPNSDKLASQLKQGSRLVFHRQVRQQFSDPSGQQKFLDALVDPSQHAMYDRDSNFKFVVGHELVHSLGPRATADGRDKNAALGKAGSMIEEAKADLGSVVMTGYFADIGKFTEQEANSILLTWAVGQLPAKQPSPDEAHRSRSLMQLNYFREKGAIKFEKGGRLSMAPELMASTGRQMLTDIVQLQLDGDPAKADAFVKKYTAWDEALDYCVEEHMKLKPKLYRLVKQPVRDALKGGGGPGA